LAKRCYLDQETIQAERVFCQNSGACGSTYIVHLLNQNNVPRSFHEKSPDLLEVGLRHYEQPLSSARLIRLLRFTRHDVFFEASNRLFSFSRELSTAFPNARFIHLHRDGAESVRSGLSKSDLSNYVANDIRFQGTLAGSAEDAMFDRYCHHWANINRRIHADLTAVEQAGTAVCSLRFEDLVQGKIDRLQECLGHSLPRKTSRAVNVRPTRQEGKFPCYADWSQQQKAAFDRICGPVMSMLGR